LSERRSMEIIIEDIPEEGLAIEATEDDQWLEFAVRDAIGEACDEGCEAKLSVSISGVEGTVTVDGDVDIVSHPICDRCAVVFSEGGRFHIHALMAPKYESERQRRMEQNLDVEIVEEDLEFSYYEGDRFDLADVVREQVALAQRMKHLCREDCAGLCQRCGKNLNEGPCGCPKEEGSGQFAALREMRKAGGTKN